MSTLARFADLSRDISRGPRSARSVHAIRLRTARQRTPPEVIISCRGKNYERFVASRDKVKGSMASKDDLWRRLARSDRLREAANKEGHVAFLKQGVKQGFADWNAWREDDLEDVDLRGRNSGGADLTGANFYEADLRRANLSGANLLRAERSGANLAGANLGKPDLRRA